MWIAQTTEHDVFLSPPYQAPNMSKKKIKKNKIKKFKKLNAISFLVP